MPEPQPVPVIRSRADLARLAAARGISARA